MKNKKITLRSNVTLQFIDEEKFNTISIAFAFKNKLDKENYYQLPLLASMLTSASKNYPSIAKFNAKKEDLYDARVHGHVSQIGGYQNLLLSFSGIDPWFVDEATYLQDLMTFVFDVVYQPYVEGNQFDIPYFEMQKQMYINQIKAADDDKEHYASAHISDLVKRAHPLKYNSYTPLAKIEQITAQQLYALYQKLMNQELIIYICGHKVYRKTKQLILNQLGKQPRKRIKAPIIVPFKEEKLLQKTIQKDWTQSQLILRYTLPAFTLDSLYFAAYVCNALLGASPVSKLFKVVREEHGLCYSIYSQYFDPYGVLDIHVGFDGKNYDLLRQLIAQQIEEIANGNFDSVELEKVKKTLIVRQERKLDTGFGMISFVHTVDMLQADLTIETIITNIKNVTPKEVQQCAQLLTLSMVYYLQQKEEEATYA